MNQPTSAPPSTETTETTERPERVSDERLRELARHHKERAIYFEQMSDNGRLSETLKASEPHWEIHDVCRELLRQRGEGGETDAWQPISTAPRDGTRVIIAWPGGGVRYAYFLDNSKTNVPWSGWRSPSLELPLPSAPPTHWQPMPPPPPYTAPVTNETEGGAR